MLSVFDSFEKTLITREDSVSMTYTSIYRWAFEISISSQWAKGEHDDLLLWISHAILSKMTQLWSYFGFPHQINVEFMPYRTNTKIFSKQMWYLIVQIWVILVPIKSFLLVSFTTSPFLFPSDFANVDCSVSQFSASQKPGTHLLSVLVPRDLHQAAVKRKLCSRLASELTLVCGICGFCLWLE